MGKERGRKMINENEEIKQLKEKIERNLYNLENLIDERSSIEHSIVNCKTNIYCLEKEIEKLEKRHYCNEMGIICKENKNGILILDTWGEKIVVRYCPICGKKVGELYEDD